MKKENIKFYKKLEDMHQYIQASGAERMRYQNELMTVKVINEKQRNTIADITQETK